MTRAIVVLARTSNGTHWQELPMGLHQHVGGSTGPRSSLLSCTDLILSCLKRPIFHLGKVQPLVLHLMWPTNRFPYGHNSLKVPNVEFGFWHKWTDRSKPNVEIKIMSPYRNVPISTQRLIQLPWMCWQQTVPNGFIEIEFVVGYFHWYKPMIIVFAKSDHTWSVE